MIKSFINKLKSCFTCKFIIWVFNMKASHIPANRINALLESEFQKLREHTLIVMVLQSPCAGSPILSISIFSAFSHCLICSPPPSLSLSLTLRLLLFALTLPVCYLFVLLYTCFLDQLWASYWESIPVERLFSRPVCTGALDPLTINPPVKPCLLLHCKYILSKLQLTFILWVCVFSPTGFISYDTNALAVKAQGVHRHVE